MSVGVIVPVYGDARYLPDALDAVLAQAPAPQEVVVVDDASPSPVRLDRRHANSCRLLRRSARGGPGAARDTALEELETELIACADADDVWHPGKLSIQLEALERAPDAAACFGRAVIAGPDGRPTGERWDTFPAGLLGPEVFAPLLFERNLIPTSSAVIRREALLEAGGFSGPPVGEDWLLWLRLVERGERFIHEPSALITYRRHPAGATADISGLAAVALSVHEAHAGLVDEATRRRVKAADLTALARGRIRERDYATARDALGAAARLVRPAPREVALRVLVGIPGLRAGLGRRGPYRGAPGRAKAPAGEPYNTSVR